MGLLGSAVRVGCLTLCASTGLEEWSPSSRKGMDRTRLTGPLAVFDGRYGWRLAGRRPKYRGYMARSTRSMDWGFPAGAATAPNVAPCRCARAIDMAAPKSAIAPHPRHPTAPSAGISCETHAGEYNRNWDYFQGLTPEEAAAREAEERLRGSGWRESSHQQWAGPGDGTRSRDEMRALSMLGLDSDATFDDVRTAWRGLAKANHPDLKPGDAEAAQRFQQVQAAWDVLRAARNVARHDGQIRQG